MVQQELASEQSRLPPHLQVVYGNVEMMSVCHWGHGRTKCDHLSIWLWLSAALIVWTLKN
jgi:hypothetical protein